MQYSANVRFLRDDYLDSTAKKVCRLLDISENDLKTAIFGVEDNKRDFLKSEKALIEWASNYFHINTVRKVSPKNLEKELKIYSLIKNTKNPKELAFLARSLDSNTYRFYYNSKGELTIGLDIPTSINFERTSIVGQIIKHLKSKGIIVHNRAEMEEYLNTHKMNDVQFSAEELSEMEEIKAKAQANGTFMKAPNGKPSNLNERQWLQVRTRAFKNWFGDWENDPANASKVVDENGEPLVVYRGTRKDSTVHTIGTFRSKVLFATPSRTGASRYGKPVALFINARNPATIN